MRIAACQPFEILGDIEASVELVARFSQKATKQQAELICFPECFLGGYVQNEQHANLVALDLNQVKFKSISQRLAVFKPIIVVGIVERDGDQLFNTAVILDQGELVGKYRKQHLLKSEKFFSPSTTQPVFELVDRKIGINICYDNQFPEAAAKMAATGAQIILCPSNNMLPIHVAKKYKDLHNFGRAQRAIEHKCWYISSDVTGERKGHLAYGPTSAINPKGEVVEQVSISDSGMLVVDV